MKKITLISAFIGVVCFLATSASAQTSTTVPATNKAEKKVATRTQLTPSVVKTLPTDSAVKVTPVTATDKATLAPTSTKCQSGTMTPACQKKCAGTSGTMKCNMPCDKKKTETDTKTVVPKK